MYSRDAPIFDTFNITAELEKALRPKVWLKSGGYIVINQTEALVAIDINTGKFVGKSNRLEDTIVKTNVEAVKEIVRQIRLRDLGGIIVVDFIDMEERKNRQKVMQALEEAMHGPRAIQDSPVQRFRFMAITRGRVKQSPSARCARRARPARVRVT
jgi:ribonuclease G